MCTSVALLAGLTGSAVQHKTVMDMGRDMEQLLQRLKNVTEQRDSLLCKQDCPGGWYKFGCKCYQVSNALGSWNKSRELCVSHGADLVVVDSKEEMDFISRYGGNNWLGATDKASEGMWRWVDGTVLLADNPSWRRGKPDGGKNKNCLRRMKTFLSDYFLYLNANSKQLFVLFHTCCVVPFAKSCVLLRGVISLKGDDIKTNLTSLAPHQISHHLQDPDSHFQGHQQSCPSVSYRAPPYQDTHRFSQFVFLHPAHPPSSWPGYHGVKSIQSLSPPPLELSAS
uniref:C-type lectin domain-containing protein n=1 Tax=Gadus morhua TaxID=8049 RepID=A0A8C5CNM7_GADMO